MKRKLLLSLSAISALGAIPMVAAACGSSNDKQGEGEVHITQQPSTVTYTHVKKPTTSVVNIQLNKDFVVTPEKISSVPKIIMINDGGDLNDKSFNQSAWEGLLTFADYQAKLPKDKYDVIEVKNDQFEQAYNQALQGGYKIWIAPGFLHGNHIEKWLNANKAQVEKQGIIIIGADYDSKLGGHGIYQKFKTKEAAFSAGYAAAMFLSNEAKPEDRTVSSFGGGAFPGVTDFIEGFYKGILYWNSKQTDANKKVHTVADKVDLTSGFAVGAAMTSVIKNVIAQNAKLILPVAGPATNVVLSEEGSKNKYIVGVDTDQALSASKGKEQFFTSILKSIGQSTYDTVATLATSDDYSKIKSKLGNFDLNKTDGNLSGGYAENWVDISPTHITDPTKKPLAEQAIKAGKEMFNKLSAEEKEWLASNKATMEGDEISTEGERLNALAAELMKK
ncbi:BMP family ABC transporter substrate-binding protein [Mycoplasmopsis californica]|uniref:BMP family ABC transporter substrate-binding protein n=1 Tax=Mycoplasmopsis californica TaxID=2113 RepID=UPI0005973361|nr:BMP family ABC transporter substrate-binding protein [Mycoplasmopsis californica]